MKVFISWSKPVSRQVAEALRDWLPLVIQDVEPWMSQADLEAGVRWGQVLSAQLQEIDFGIICLTAENRLEPWIHFEAGALSKQVATARVVPLLFRMETTALPSPLQQFQAKLANRDGVWSVITSIYSVLQKRAPTFEALERTFIKWWPELEEKWNSITIPEGAPESPPFDQQAAIEEILLAVRGLSRNGSTRVGAPATLVGVSSGDGEFSITNSSGLTLRFLGVIAPLARFASDYLDSHGINWTDALSHKLDISDAAFRDPSLANKFLTRDKFHDAMVNALKKFEVAGMAQSGLVTNTPSVQS